MFKEVHIDIATALQMASQPAIREGMIVIVHDESIPPMNWTLGCICHTKGGTDGHIKGANVKTKNGHIRLLIVKLTPHHGRRKTILRYIKAYIFNVPGMLRIKRSVVSYLHKL